MNPLDEYIPLCCAYYSYSGEGIIATYEIDNEPVCGSLWFPDPRYRACRLMRETFDLSELDFEMPSDDISDSLHSPLCSGGDLDPRRLLLAYSYGIFPWFDFTEPSPSWWAPLSRFVLFPDEIHISHSMRSLLNKKNFRITINQAFPDVIEACRTVNGRNEDKNGAWLGEDIVKAYTELWRRGYVKSVEVWNIDEDKLIGGLYGVWLNGCFMGESMFSFAPSGSKIALVALCEWMRENGGKVIDLQIETDHLKSMGGRHIGYLDYLKIINPTVASSPLLDIRYPDDNLEH